MPRPEFRLPKHVLTLAEVEKVIATPDVKDGLGLRHRAIVETLYATAMRRSELGGLSVYDVDAERGAVRIRHGKGDKDCILPQDGAVEVEAAELLAALEAEQAEEIERKRRRFHLRRRPCHRGRLSGRCSSRSEPV